MLLAGLLAAQWVHPCESHKSLSLHSLRPLVWALFFAI